MIRLAMGNGEWGIGKLVIYLEVFPISHMTIATLLYPCNATSHENQDPYIEQIIMYIHPETCSRVNHLET